MYHRDKNNLKALFSGSLATLCEWYDYALYGYFSPLIAEQFFPSEEKLTSLLSMFAVFATGFIVRPLGAIVFGYVGDRLGRKYALSSSVMMMAIPTALIGCLPTYTQIGTWAAFLLVLIRMIQGFAVGGNYGGAFVFAIEYAPIKRKGLFGSCLMVGTIAGILLGSVVAMLCSYLFTPETLMCWGWRIPFVLGALSILTGVYIRKNVNDTENVQKMIVREAKKTPPLRAIFSTYKKQICIAVCVILPDVVGIYMMFFFMTAYLTTILGWSMETALTINTFNLFCMVLFIPFFGWLSDKIGSKIILYTVALVFVFLSIPVFLLLGLKNFWITFFSQFIFAVALGAYYGGMPVTVVEYFPIELRYTAAALVFNIAAAIFGGTTLWVSTYLINLTHYNESPGFYLTLVGIVTTFALGKMYKARTTLNKKEHIGQSSTNTSYK